jgi:hypothetical protein
VGRPFLRLETGPSLQPSPRRQRPNTVQRTVLNRCRALLGGSPGYARPQGSQSDRRSGAVCLAGNLVSQRIRPSSEGVTEVRMGLGMARNIALGVRSAAAQRPA